MPNSYSPVLLFAASLTALPLLLLVPSALGASAPASCLEGDGACPGSSLSLLQSKFKLSGSVDVEGKRYTHVRGEMDWAAAEARCVELGGHLAKITSAVQNGAVRRLVGSSLVWLGAKDSTQEGKWTWSDGSSLAGYTNWAKGQPDNAGGGWECQDYKGQGEDCLTMGHWTKNKNNGQWNDHCCGPQAAKGRAVSGYVCSTTIIITTTTTTTTTTEPCTETRKEAVARWEARVKADEDKLPECEAERRDDDKEQCRKGLTRKIQRSYDTIERKFPPSCLSSSLRSAIAAAARAAEEAARKTKKGRKKIR